MTTEDPPTPQYTVEATSQEEGIAVDAPPPLIPPSDPPAPSSSAVRFRESLEAATARAVDGQAAACERPASTESVQRSDPSASVDSGPRKRTSSTVKRGKNGDGDGGSIELAGGPSSPQEQLTTLTPMSTTISPSYYTARPKRRSFLPSSLSLGQRLREYRHSRCMMTPLSFLVLSAVVLSSLVTLAFMVPQFLLGILLGPLIKRNFWLVEFLYRFKIAEWGHVKIMQFASKSRSAGGKSGKGGKKDKKGKEGKKSAGAGGGTTGHKDKLGGHSATLRQRIEVVPDRVYVHPIPQFTDDIAYLIVCTPPPSAVALPLTAILVDCGEHDVILRHIDKIYGEHYARKYPTANGGLRQSLFSESVSTGNSFFRGRDDDRPGLSSCTWGASEASGMDNSDYSTKQRFRTTEIEIFAVACTHRHPDHTAGVGALVRELTRRRKEEGEEDIVLGTGARQSRVCGSYDGGDSSDIYKKAPGNVVVVGGAIEDVPHCNLFVKNRCFVPLPCISLMEGGKASQVNDMNELISLEVICVPSHTRGSVVYALRNRAAPGVSVPIGGRERAPLQSHLFAGDAVFTGGGGVPFEADLELAGDNFVKNPKSLQRKNGNSRFRPGAGTLSMERCFAEVLTRAAGPWAEESPESDAPQDPAAGTSSPRPGSTLLYPGHEYTTALLMRQFDQKTSPSDGYWTRMPPSVFFETASHYLVSAHRRALPQGQKLLTVPTPLGREMVVNPNFRSLKRRGEAVVRALKLWYEFGAKNLVPNDPEEDENNVVAATRSKESDAGRSVFTTVYTDDLDEVVRDLRNGAVTGAAAADRISSLPGRLEEKIISRRPIPSTLPSHKNVYLGVVALAILGSPPSAATISDANIMDMAPPVECTDSLIISKRRLIAVLDGLGLLSQDASPRLPDIIHLLWQEARLDSELNLGTDHPNGTDVENSLKMEDAIELGLLKFALFGVVSNQPAKFCLPCGGGSRRPTYEKESWVTKSKLRRTGGELVRHDPTSCPLSRDVLRQCP